MQNIKLSISDFGYKLVEKGYTIDNITFDSPKVYDFKYATIVRENNLGLIFIETDPIVIDWPMIDCHCYKQLFMVEKNPLSVE